MCEKRGRKEEKEEEEKEEPHPKSLSEGEGLAFVVLCLKDIAVGKIHVYFLIVYDKSTHSSANSASSVVKNTESKITVSNRKKQSRAVIQRKNFNDINL